jgi:hypothetical protein
MFQSKDEADKRRNNERNLFSPTYVPPVRSSDKGTSEDSKDKEATGGSDSGPGESSEACSNGEANISASSIDSIVGKITTDPYSVRRRTTNLRGQTDVQVAVGTTSILLGNKTSGDLYGLSQEQSRAYGGGLSSTRDITEQKISNEVRYKKIGRIREELAEKAARRLDSALESLDDTKIEVCSATKLAGIAKDMAVVMDKVTRDNTKPDTVHFHLFKPELKTLGDYTTVQLSSPLIIQPPGGGADT